MKERGIKAAELSRRTNIAKGTISNYVTGRYKAAQTNLHVLAEALNVQEAWLMGYDMPMNKPKDNRTMTEIIQDIGKPLSVAEYQYYSNYEPGDDPIEDMLVSSNEMNMIINIRGMTEEHRKTIIDLINLYARKDEEYQEKED